MYQHLANIHHSFISKVSHIKKNDKIKLFTLKFKFMAKNIELSFIKNYCVYIQMLKIGAPNRVGAVSINMKTKILMLPPN